MPSADDTSDTLAAAQALLIPTYAPLPIVPVEGEGSTVRDRSGRDYIDLAGGIAVTSLGHNHPALRAALEQQAGRLWHLSNIFANEPAIALAQKLTDLTFADRVFFANSGAEANEAALKLARRHAYNNGHPEKYGIIALEGAFHGRTLFTVAAGGTPAYSEGYGPPPEGISHVPPGDAEALAAAVDERTCAVIIEPILGESGVRPLSPEYLRAAREICDRHDALLIFDEVQTGAGRTGTLFAYEQLGVTPDVLTSAKGLGGGFPIGATLAAEPQASALGRATHGTTFGGNPLACAVAGAVIDEVSKPELLANVAARHKQLTAGLAAADPDRTLFAEIRGAGLLIGAELTEPFTGRAKELQLACLDAGVMTLIAGANVLRLAPALNLTEAEAVEGLQRLTAAVETLRP